MTFKKYEAASSGATHKAVDATIVDILMPHTELADSSGNFIRSAVYAAGGWLARGKKETGSWGF